jgi:hypothetical protein
MQAILTQSEDQRGRVKIPATELRTMAELINIISVKGTMETKR